MTLSETQRTLSDLYPGRLANLLVHLCFPARLHRHREESCGSPGKVPLPPGWNAQALARWRNGEDVALVCEQAARHLASGGNVGWVVPPGLVVLDADSAEAVTWLHTALPDAPYQESRVGRGHFVVRAPSEIEIQARVKVELAPGVVVDLRVGGRSQIVVEPSVHATGARYTWKRPLPPDLGEIPLCPPLLWDAIVAQAGARRSETLPRSDGQRVEEGARNDRLFRLGCAMRSRGASPAEIEAALQVRNREDCDPPLPESEVRAISTSASRYVRGAEDSDSDYSSEVAGSVSSGEPWEPPVEFDADVCGPPLAPEALPSMVREYVEETADSYQIALDFTAACAVGVLSAACARRAEVAIGETHVEPLNAYWLPILGPGERKVVVREIAAPLEELEHRLGQEKFLELEQKRQMRAITTKRIKNLQQEAASEENPASRARNATEAARLLQEMPDEIAAPQLLIDDATPEATARVMAEQHGVLAILSEEAGGLFEVLAGRYSNDKPALDVHLKAYDGGTIRVNRISREPVYVHAPALTILVTPQPIILDRIAELPDFRGRGLLGRCAFVLPESRVGTRMYVNRRVDPKMRANWAALVERLARLPIAKPGEVPKIRLSGEALDLWAQYTNDLEIQQAEGQALAGIRDWAGKHAGRAARIAGLFHLVRHAERVEPWAEPLAAEDVAAAWVVAQWLQAHALVAFERMGASQDVRLARRILRWIRRHHPADFSLRDLHQHHRDVDRPEVLLPGLAVLEGRGFVRRIPDPSSGSKVGRPASPRWEVNPLTHKSRKSQNPLHSDGRGWFSDFGDFCEEDQP